MLAWLEQAEAQLHHDARAIYDIHRTQRLLQGAIADDQPANDVRRLMVTGLRTWQATNSPLTEQELRLLIEYQVAAALVPLVLVRYAPLGWVCALAAFSSQAAFPSQALAKSQALAECVSLAQCVLQWRNSFPTPRADGLPEQQRAALLRDIARREVLAGAASLVDEWAAIARGEREVAAAFLAGEQVREARHWTVPQVVRWLAGAAVAGWAGNRFDALMLQGITRLLDARKDEPNGGADMPSATPDRVDTATSLRPLKLVATLAGHRNAVFGVAWSPDGTTLASGSVDKTVRLWSAQGQPITTLTGHASQVESVAWSPDGKTLASGSVDKTVQLWR